MWVNIYVVSQQFNSLTESTKIKHSSKHWLVFVFVSYFTGGHKNCVIVGQYILSDQFAAATGCLEGDKSSVLLDFLMLTIACLSYNHVLFNFILLCGVF